MSATTLVPGEQRILLRGTTWKTYELLLAERGEAPFRASPTTGKSSRS